MQTVDVIIIGAGAAGLMCAFTAAQRGRKVLVLDHANKAGKKILMSGGGRCNFTNMYTEPDNFLSNNPHFCKSALARYTQWDFIEMVQRHQIPYHEKKLGQLFCDNKANDILQMLLDECADAGAKIELNTSIESIQATDTGFTLKSKQQTFKCKSLVIASGALSIPTLGATGFGYQVAEQFGHTILPTRAGLVPFTLTDPQLKDLCTALSGTSIDDCVVQCNGQSFKEDLLFTHRGLSGPVILQISSYWLPGNQIEVNLLSDRDASTWLLEQQAQQPNVELKTVLSECFTRKMAQWLCEHWFTNTPLKQYNAKQLEAIGQQLNQWQLTPSGTEGYRTAEITLGGIDTQEVSSKTMQSQKQDNLYFIGEVLDVSGHLGGFNFQWAWASGHAAGIVV
ncbi:MAG: NAD(P)/FAD-dependent oxidoreductase [Gammaproteobacteria bacterium]|nr:NAD(P)/FAD-dependent oxidoreductase [Gammaproteobacteria bacterium]